MNVKNILTISWLLGALMLSAATHAGNIRIGTTQSCVYQQFGKEQVRGLQMWVDDINARGALLGQTVELVHYDDHSETERVYLRISK